MRHQKAGRKLGRTTGHRNAVFRNMLASFFDKEKIETTTAKAKELRPLAEKLITLGKRGDLHARRSVLRIIPHTGIVRKLFTEIAPRFERRAGGYTRIIRTGYRAGDQAPMSVIELVVEEVGTGKKKEKKKKKVPAQSKAEGKKAAARAAAPARQDEERQKPSPVTATDHQQAGPEQVQADLPEETTVSPREESAGAEAQAGKDSSGAASAAGEAPEGSSEK